MSEQVVVLTVKNERVPGEKIIRLHKRRAVLGSSTSADLKLDDKSISGVHAILEVSGVDGKPVIYDLASETGIQVNGKSTVQATLEPSDSVQIGPYVIQIRVQELSEVPRAPAQVREAVGGRTLFVNEKEDLAPLLLEDENNILDIFDHRPEMKTSLQMVMFFEDTILDVEHFVNKKRVVIGPGTREDFSIPQFLGKGKRGRFDLVTKDGDQYYLHLHDQMTGVVSQGGKMSTIRDVLGNMATSIDKAFPLGEKDFAKVQLGDVSFFMNFTAAPPRLKLPRFFERDPAFFKIWLASFLLTSAALVGVSQMHVEPSIEIEQLPERTQTVILNEKIPVPKPPPTPAPKPVETPKPVVEATPKPTPKPKPKPKVVIEVKPTVKPKPEPKHAEIAQKKPAPKPVAHVAKAPLKPRPAPLTHSGGNAGEGAKARGKEGSQGKANAKPATTHQLAAKRPGAGDPHKAAQGMGGKSETDDMGVVDMFKNDKGTLQKVLAGGKGVANAANKLEGYSGFSTQGNGGLGQAGSGEGGGGTSQGIGGQGEKGAGGGKHGTGIGQLGSGGNMFGSSGKMRVEGGGSPEPIVMGAIDTDAIARAIAAHRDEIKYCYEKEINAEHPDIQGRVSVRFVIGASGVVSSAGIASTSLHNANTEQCIADVIKRIDFPPVRGGGVAEVTYPFVFKPSNK